MALDKLTKITSQSGITTTIDYQMSDLTVDTITVQSGGLKMPVGMSTFQNVTVTGDLTVNGTTTTLDTDLIGVDKLEVSGNNTTAVGIITQAGSGDILRLYDNTTQAVTVQDGGRVLIGTTDEGHGNADDLTIATAAGSLGNTGITIRSSTTGDGNIFFSDATSGTGETRGVIKYAHDGDSLRFNTAGDERLRIDSSGRIGIGTDTMDSSAEVSITNDSSSARVYMKSADDADCSIYFGSMNDAATGAVRYDHSDDSLRLYGYNNSERLRIDSSGNVGIGTDDTSLYNNTSGTGIMLRGGHAIDIARDNDLQLTVNRLTADGANIGLYQAGALKATIGTKSGGIYFGTGGDSEGLRIKSDGDVILGGSSNAGYPNYADNLTIHDTQHSGITIRSGIASQGAVYFSDTTGTGSGTYEGYVIYDHSSNDLRFATNHSERLRINSNGRVNIADSYFTNNDLDYCKLNIYGATSGVGTDKNLNLLNVYNYGSGNPGDITGIGLGAAASPDYTKASLAFIRTSSYGVGDLIFCVNSEGNANMVTESDEKLRIRSGGGVGIGESIYHLGDDDTWMGFPGANLFKVATGGSTRIYIDSSGLIWNRKDTSGVSTTTMLLNHATNANGNGVSLAFAPTQNYPSRFSSIDVVQDGNNNMHMLFKTTDASQNDHAIERLRITSAGKVGIGENNPTFKTEIKVSDTTAYSSSSIANTQTQLRINNAGASGVAGILLTAEPSSGSAGYASIRTIAPASGSADLIFSTRSSSTFAERLRITSAGHLEPGANTTYTCGTSSKRWNAVYSNTLSLSSYASVGSIVAADPGSAYYSWNNRIGSGLAVVGTTYFNDYVGIGTQVPNKTGIQNGVEVLEISGGDGGELIVGNHASHNVSAAMHVGSIAFKNIDSSTGSVPHYAGIRCKTTDTSGNMDLRFYTGINKFETDRPQVLINNVGMVGIGTDAPGESLHINSSTPAIRLTDTDTDGPLHCDIESVSGDLYLDTGSVHRDVIMSSAGRANEIAKFEGDGNVLIGGRVAIGDETTTGHAGQLQVIHNGGGNQTGDVLVHLETNANDWIMQLENDEGAGTAHFVYFKKDGNNPGSITASNTQTNFNTSGSDRELKKNFESWTEDTLSLFKNINPQKFHFKFEDDIAEKTKGFIAQDMLDKFPEAYPKDRDGYYKFNPSGMVAYLMKALQEEIVKREALEARISALEGS